jgi:hypothetical protein
MAESMKDSGPATGAAANVNNDFNQFGFGDDDAALKAALAASMQDMQIQPKAEEGAQAEVPPSENSELYNKLVAEYGNSDPELI